MGDISQKTIDFNRMSDKKSCDGYGTGMWGHVFYGYGYVGAWYGGAEVGVVEVNFES